MAGTVKGDPLLFLDRKRRRSHCISRFSPGRTAGLSGNRRRRISSERLRSRLSAGHTAAPPCWACRSNDWVRAFAAHLFAPSEVNAFVSFV